MILHVGMIACRLAGEWRGALIEGPSGVGKSDLALRALDHGFSLVSDDYTVVFASNGQLYGRAPDALAGLIEARGVGVLPQPCLPFCRVRLLVRCVEDPLAVERMPDPQLQMVAGVATPLLQLWPLEAAAPTKVRRMLEHLGVAG
jgi:serine kinase of HPr protein (carbohydrate metabolism regulator)